MKELQQKAYAKINLALDVVGRLENGYHLVKMVMQTVGIYDVLTFERTEGEIRITTDNGELPCDKENLIYRAAQLMMETYGLRGGVRVHLEKHIPIAAGMAGGSTDAAATLQAINELYELGLSREELMTLGVKIGADVPYCIMGGTALSEGIGEVLTPLKPLTGGILLVAKPGVNVSTGEVYRRLDQTPLPTHPDVEGMVKAIEEGDLDGMIARLGNVLEEVTIPLHPQIRELKELMLEEGAVGSLMSGSGPTVFGLFATKEQAARAQERIRGEHLAAQVSITEFVTGR